jgi:hypothetical protein
MNSIDDIHARRKSQKYRNRVGELRTAPIGHFRTGVLPRMFDDFLAFLLHSHCHGICLSRKDINLTVTFCAPARSAVHGHFPSFVLDRKRFKACGCRQIGDNGATLVVTPPVKQFWLGFPKLVPIGWFVIPVQVCRIDQVFPENRRAVPP